MIIPLNAELLFKKLPPFASNLFKSKTIRKHPFLFKERL